MIYVVEGRRVGEPTRTGGPLRRHEIDAHQRPRRGGRKEVNVVTQMEQRGNSIHSMLYITYFIGYVQPLHLINANKRRDCLERGS